MDQVKTIALAVWQQRFWLLSAISIIVAFVCWNNATTDLSARFAQRKSAIGNSFASVQSIKNENPFHPNENVNQGDAQQIEVQKTYVGKLWSDLYEQQKTKVLFWPELGDNFAEKMAEKQFLEEINSLDMRDMYRDYAKSQFDSLRKIVKASTNTSSSRSGNRSGASTAEKEKEDYLVTWLDQSALLNRLDIKTTPSYKRIWVTQEDIWVYTTLLNVIGKTNERQGATRPDNTAVSSIIKLQVGKYASDSNAKEEDIYIPSVDADRNRVVATYDTSSEGLEPQQEDEVLLADRYLSPDGTPYPGESQSFGTEYRRLPIHMVLKMDQRAIPVVLVECANAPLPIEVTRLSVNRSKSNSSGFSSARSVIRAANPSNRNGNEEEDQRELSEVDIQGVVLIYMPPDETVVPAPEQKPTT